MKKMVTKVADLIHGGDYNPDQWLLYPEILERDAELMREAGCNAMSIGIFAWATLEPEEGKYNFEWLDQVIDRLYAHGVYTILATPSAARPAWMAEKYPEVLRVNSDNRRILFSARHNHCYSSPIYREKVRQMNTALATRYSHHPAVILWHVSNEYGGACYCDLCKENFRNWLKKKYGTLENLNHAWWSYFWSKNFTSWDQINPPMDNGEHSLHGMNLDWKRLTTDMTVDFMEAEIKPLKEANPSLPVTANLMGFYPGLNYFKFKNVCDVISWDNYPAWHEGDDQELACSIAMAHDLMRSIKPSQPFMLMESVTTAVNWKEYAKMKRPGMHELSSLQAVARGSDSIQYFQWRKGRGGSEKFHGAVVGHLGSNQTREFRDVAALGKRMKGLSRLVGSPFEAKAAVIWDTENRWALDDLQGLIQKDKGYMKEALHHYGPLFREGVNVDVIDEESDFTPYQLIAAPMLYMYRAGVAEKLRAFVENGGTLVTTYWSGVVNETDLCFLGGFPGDGMNQVMGVDVEEIDTLYPQDANSATILPCETTRGMKARYTIEDYTEVAHLNGATALATYDDDFISGLPAFTVQSFGKGKVYYIAACFEQSFYDDLYKNIIEDLSLKTLDVTLPKGVFLSDRTLEDGTSCYIFQNFNTEEAIISLPREMECLECGEKITSLTIPAYGTVFLI
ncbi:MAG: beta-galactosidase [Clostridia bacterium]|nr:beta-galactosidase [Clostridia bacterium]